MHPTPLQSNFDEAAASYDVIFTNSTIGKLQRERVYHWMDQSGLLNRPKSIYEINCGTGFDAEKFHLEGHTIIASDASVEMIKQAQSIRNEAIVFNQKTFKEVLEDEQLAKSQLLFSNFGGLNCIDRDELKGFLHSLADIQQKGNSLALVLMSNRCLMEDLYFLFNAQWKKIGRRKQKAMVNVNGQEVETFYHAPKSLQKLLENSYKMKLIKPVAIALPPSYLEPFFSRNRWLLQFLNNFEKLFGRFGVLARWSDHYIIIAERK